MLDYGRAQALFARTGRAWNHASQRERTRVHVPENWDSTQPHAWDACLAELDFEEAEITADYARWIYTHAPTEIRAGVTIIVGNNDTPDGMFECHYTVDTVETENDSAWGELPLPTRFATPLEAARYGIAMMRAMLGGAIAELKDLTR